MAKKAPTSTPITGPIPKAMRLPEGRAIDRTTLPKPKPEAWGGWQAAPQPKREAKS